MNMSRLNKPAVLITKREIDVRVNSLALDIANKESQVMTIVSLLKGSFVFTADLIRELSSHNMSLEVEFLGFSSYGNAKQSSGALDMYGELRTDVSDKRVLLIDDILETGGTLVAAKDMLVKAGAKSVKICVLLKKNLQEKPKIDADYVGFEIENEFVVGYGLDYANKYRELPYIGITH